MSNVIQAAERFAASTERSVMTLEMTRAPDVFKVKASSDWTVRELEGTIAAYWHRRFGFVPQLTFRAGRRDSSALYVKVSLPDGSSPSEGVQ